MGILSRLKALFRAWISRAVPEQPEDPQLSLDRSLVRLEQSQRDIRRSLVEVNAARLKAALSEEAVLWQDARQAEVLAELKAEVQGEA